MFIAFLGEGTAILPREIATNVKALTKYILPMTRLDFLPAFPVQTKQLNTIKSIY